MISLDELKSYLKVPHELTDEDALIVQLEEAAVKLIQNKTGHYFGPPETVTELVSGGEIDGYPVMWLKDAPRADGITPGVAVDVEEFDGSDWTAVEAGDFEIDGFGLYHDSGWSTGFRNVRVTYSRGYGPGEEPADIRNAVLELVSEWFEHRENFHEGQGQELPFHVKDLIGSYRRVRV